MRAVTTQKRSLRDNGGIDRHWEAINRNATQIASHEAMCEERSKTIFNRLDRIDDSLETMNKRMFSLGVMLLGGMAGLIVTLLLK